MPAAEFIIANLAIAVASWQVAAQWSGKSDRSFQLLTAFASFAVLVTLLMQIAGVLGWFQPGRMTALAVGVAVIVVVAVRKRRAFDNDFENSSLRDPADKPWQLAGISLLAAFGGVLALRTLTGGTAFFSDDFGYHAVAALHWMKEGGFSPMPPEYVATYPYGSELFSLWFMLPFRDTTWAGLAGLFWGVFAAVAVYCGARGAGGSRAAAWLASALAIAAPEVAFLVRTFSATDLACSVTIIAATVLYAHPAHGSQPSLPFVILSGAMGGIAVGSKVSLAPAAAVLAVAILFERTELRSKALRLVCFVCAALATGGYWYLSNWIETGNPLFPAAIGPFDGPFSKVEQQETTLLHVLRGQHSRSFWIELLTGYLNWPFGIALIAFAGYVMAMSRHSAGYRGLRLRLLAIGLLVVALHPVTPFSHGSGLVNGAMQPYLRYILPGLMVGIVLAAPLFNSDRRWGLVWSSLAIVAAATAWPGPGKSQIVAFGFAAFTAFVFDKGWHGRFAVALGVAVILAVPMLTPSQRAATRRGIYEEGATQRQPIGAAWEVLDRLPDRSTVTALTNFPFHRSALYGSRAQLRPVYFHRDGSVRRTLSQEYLANPASTNIFPKPWASLSGNDWVTRLRSAGAEYVLVSKWRGSEWPPPFQPIRETGKVETIFEDGYSVVWKLLP